jgi:hypothetical protein
MEGQCERLEHGGILVVVRLRDGTVLGAANMYAN